jgi:hypothetical protein
VALPLPTRVRKKKVRVETKIKSIGWTDLFSSVRNCQIFLSAFGTYLSKVRSHRNEALKNLRSKHDKQAPPSPDRHNQ